MKRPALLAGAAALGLSFALSSTAARASDPVGIYALIDRVVLEPAPELPGRIQVWGALVLAQGFGGDGGFYSSPVRGYLYYSLPAGQEELARNEWADLQSLAGSGLCAAFGSRYQERGRVRPASEEPAGPDPYPVAMGVQKLKTDTGYEPIRSLLSLPAPVFPPDGSSRVESGKVTLVAGNILDPARASALYVFEIESPWGEKEVSPPLPAGKGETRWSPSLALRAGREYVWRVRAVDGSWNGPPAVAGFTLPFLRADVNADSWANLSDAVALLEHLFQGGAAPRPREAGDIDDNGELEISDSIYLLTYLFLGGTRPPPPFPEAGLIPRP